ncbi:hypothetical protein AVEN_186576-1 [Araneus ventricosus]|uniref:Uncharacterized protein n=1 Tax=Araneus ventricosus TaxID=182803 RepID=A0A4Y2VL71_ARAVE|nr:hypothetical protein AVEN_186576-1 [Araneus ventricosus]
MTHHHGRAEPTVTSNIYLDILQLYAVQQFLEGVIFNRRTTLRRIVREPWIQYSPSSKVLSATWSPRSPDITPLDFYLWVMKQIRVQCERINDINHLKQRITNVIHLLHQTSLPVCGKNWTIVYVWATNGASNCAEQVCKPESFPLFGEDITHSLFRCFPLTGQNCTMTLLTHCRFLPTTFFL